MRKMREETTPSIENAPRFYSVAQVARMFGMSEMTLYRAIKDGGFPVVKVRSRLLIPAKAIDDMASAAVHEKSLVDASNWATSKKTNATGLKAPQWDLPTTINELSSFS